MTDDHSTGIPQVECRCAGDPEAMGVTQGIALKQKIQATLKSLRYLEALQLQRPQWLPHVLFMRSAEHRVAPALVEALGHSNPAMLAKLRGIAVGSGLPLRSLCLMNAMEAFIGSLDDRTFVPPLGACSALSVRGTRSRDREPIIVRNFDYLPLFQPFYTLRESRPRGAFRSLDFIVAPQAGTLDGVNEMGLAITINYAFVTDQGQPNPLISMLVADALSTCSSVAEATRRITTAPHWGAAILMLADASGDLASIELSNTASGVRRPVPGEDYLLATNISVCPQTMAVQVPRTAVYSPSNPAPLRGKPVLKPHLYRLHRIEELLGRHKDLGPDDLAAIMSDHGPTGVPDGTSPCVHTDYFNTTAVLQWFPARRSVRVSFTRACVADYVELRLY